MKPNKAIPNSKQVVRVGFRYLNPTYKNYNVAVRGMTPHSAKKSENITVGVWFPNPHLKSGTQPTKTITLQLGV
ncbi:MAG: hypothetical protein F6K40_16335 [Okeania sp. SIO3I5]|uniref:hypothetical protein n=1 Tax=Okeania sp. SIO3I5 TaxID=2607805 RepID=UPI0013B64769|nr:hypothetical protein [Okeania sp. SIO3I5]NEQ37746.1 hypothetical protein [Okeania sp. SIO3I5]